MNEAPPQARDAEECVLGAILINNAAYDRVASYITAADFFGDANRTVFAAMARLMAAGKPIDLLTVKAEVARAGSLERVGGGGYISSLLGEIPDIANVEQYAEMVREAAARRRLMMDGAAIVEQARAGQETAEEIASRFALKLTASTAERSALTEVRSTVAVAIGDTEARAVSGDHITGIPFGLPELDGYTLGIQRGVESLLAARPRVGKTAFALAIALFNARAKRNVLFVQLDMSEQMIGKRIVSSESGVSYAKIRSGQFITPADWKSIAAAEAGLSKLPGRLQFEYGTRDLGRLSAMIRTVARAGLDLVIIDHIGHVSGAGAERRYLEIGAISSRFIELAKDTGAGLLALVQLKRDADEREPSLSDMRESGNLEQDARLVVMLDRPHIRGEANYPECALRLLVPKNEGEAGGKMDAHFDGDIQRISQEPTRPCRYCQKNAAVVDTRQMELRA